MWGMGNPLAYFDLPVVTAVGAVGHRSPHIEEEYLRPEYVLSASEVIQAVAK